MLMLRFVVIVDQAVLFTPTEMYDPNNSTDTTAPSKMLIV